VPTEASVRRPAAKRPAQDPAQELHAPPDPRNSKPPVRDASGYTRAVRWALVLFLFAACDDEPTERGKLEPLPESVRRAALAAQADAGEEAASPAARPPSPAARPPAPTAPAPTPAAPAGPSPAPAAKAERPDAGATPRVKRALPKAGPFEITRVDTSAMEQSSRATTIRGDASGAKVQLGTATAKLSGPQAKHLMDALDKLDWPNLESQALNAPDGTTMALTIRRGGVEQKASLYGGCECGGSHRPTAAERCTCPIDDAIRLIDKTAADAVIAAMRATTVNVPPAPAKVSGAVKETVKCHNAICQRGSAAPDADPVYCFATNKADIVACRAGPAERSFFAKLDGDLGKSSLIWAFEVAGGLSCLARARGHGDCSDHEAFNDFVPVAGGWATYRGGVPVPLTKAWWTGPPPKNGR
jgi:hypothetical protein